MNEVDKASWAMLRDHHERGAVFLVKDLDLVDAAVALAQDQAAKVKIWLDGGNLVKVEDEDAENYEKSASEENFQFIIIQPYVLIKLMN